MPNNHTPEAELLKEIPPFDLLEPHDFQYALEQMSAFYLNEASREDIIRSGRSLLYLVRSGVYDLVTPADHALERLEKGDLFGFPSLLSGRVASNQIRVIQPGIIWTWPEEAFHKLRQRSPEFERYFIDAHKRRLLQEHYIQPSLTENFHHESRADWAAMRLVDALTRAPLIVQPSTEVYLVAQQMSALKSSSALVLDEAQLLVGILTDRDIRERVVAQQLDGRTPVKDIMTHEPKTLHTTATLFDALTLMGVWNTHHIPVLDTHQKPLGVLTLQDLMKYQQSEPVALLRALHQSETYEALLEVAKQAPIYLQNLQKNLPETGKGTVLLGRYIASLSDTLTRKLIGLYEAIAGTAPIPYAWVAFESQARQDQTPDSEQSNGLILADTASQKDRDWFHGLATYVCNGLAACGIPFSSLGILAKEPAWCLTLSEWQIRCQQWTTEGFGRHNSQENKPTGLLISMLAADSRCIEGQTEFHRKYRRWLAGYATNPAYLSKIARYVNQQKVPLGLFYRLRSGGEERAYEIDLKHTGIATINHVIRLYAFAAELEMPNTIERLAALKGLTWLQDDEIESLADAWYFLSGLRLTAQMNPTDEEERALHTINPALLSTLQRRQLKAVFRVIKEAKQRVLYQFGRVL